MLVAIQSISLTQQANLASLVQLLAELSGASAVAWERQLRAGSSGVARCWALLQAWLSAVLAHGLVRLCQDRWRCARLQGVSRTYLGKCKASVIPALRA